MTKRPTRIKFTVRWLLVAVAVVAVSLAVVRRQYQWRIAQERAIAEIVKLGGNIGVNGIRGRVEPERRPVVAILLADPHVSDSTLALLRPQFDLLPELETLDFTGAEITDAGLVHLKGLENLRELVLNDTKVTNAGLDQLKGLKELRLLGLDGTNVTASGLTRLKHLSNLEEIYLVETKTTDADLERLAADLKLRGYWPNLKFLNLQKTPATEFGLKRLSNFLPHCEILGGDEGDILIPRR